MKVSSCRIAEVERALGITMVGTDTGELGTAGVGAAWVRVPPGHSSTPDQHDETEAFVVVHGSGEITAGGVRRPLAAGDLVLFEPFETHVVANTGTTPLVFLTLYWRDAQRAAEEAAGGGAARLAGRPQFVCSTPPTPNGDLHLGHLSGPYLGADAYVRFQRMNGAEAWHLTGSDDFQSYVPAAARVRGEDAAGTAAHYSAEIAATLALMDIQPDQYTVTSADPGYPSGLRAFFSRLVGSGSVTPLEGAALFDAGTDTYLYEVDVSGGCPTCGSGTSGNICEECGEPNSVTDLAEPVASRTGAAAATGTAVRYSLPLHEFRAEVEAHHRVGRVPARLRELAHRVFQRPRLDVAVTHPSAWGVTPAEAEGAGQVIWVWPEMAYGFLHGAEALGSRLDRPWRASAPQDDWKIVHFFGYDNSFYHCVLYPALYRLAHPGWKPDIDYHVNEFYLLEGTKFSTSRLHAVWGKEVLRPDTVDAVRYFLAATRPEGRRTDFRTEAFRTVLRDDLVGTWQRWLGGLGDRIEKEYSGTAPDAGVWRPEHTAFLDRLGTRRTALAGSLGADGFSLNLAAAELNGLVRDVVRFSAQQDPAEGLDGCRSEARTAIALELAAARLLARCAAPVLPRFAARLAQALGDGAPVVWPRSVELVAPGTPIGLAGEIFFSESAFQGTPLDPELT